MKKIWGRIKGWHYWGLAIMWLEISLVTASLFTGALVLGTICKKIWEIFQ